MSQSAEILIPPQSRGFLPVLLVACVATVFAALTINVLGNREGLFPSPVYPAMTERAWKTRRVDDAVRAGRTPEVVILGDSRVMCIQPAYVAAITGKRTFNYGVSMGMPTEFLAQLRYLYSMGCRPSLAIVGVDEFTFALDDSPSKAELLGHAPLCSFAPLRDQLQILATAVSHCNISTTLANLQRLMQSKSISRLRDDANYILLDDGYLIYRDTVRQIEAGTFDLLSAMGTPDPEKVQNQHTLRPRRCRLFEEFLTLAAAEGTEVRVILLPIQPQWEHQIRTTEFDRGRSDLQAYLCCACRKNASFHDFTDLNSFQGDPRGFFDSVHLTPANTRRMINVLFRRNPDDTVAEIASDVEILNDLPTVTTISTE